jgi:4-hydroxybenzoate polyprenyltransferase
MDQRKSKIIGVVLGCLSFLVGLYFANKIDFEPIKEDNLILIVGLIIFIIATSLLFKDKRIIFFIGLGIIFILASYIIIFYFFESNTKLIIVLFPIIILISAVFLIIGVFKMVKDIYSDKNRR